MRRVLFLAAILAALLMGRTAAGRIGFGMGYTPLLPDPGIFTVRSAPDGGWTSPQYPKAVSYNGYTYVNWINGSTGALFVAAINETTGAVSTPVQIDSMGGDPDTHGAAALLVRDSDHKLIVAFSLHGGSNMFIRVSTTSLDTDPDLSDGFVAAVNLDSSIGASNYTYPSLIQLTSVANDPIYLFYRDEVNQTGRLAYTKSTDGGATWSARTLVVTGASTQRGYWSITSDSLSRIDVMMTDRDPYGSEGAVDLGHMYFDGSAWHKSDGTTISATQPFAHSQLTQLETDTVGSFAMDGISGANPEFVYLVDEGSSIISAHHTRWDGAAWDTTDLYTAPHHPLDRYFGSLAINRADTDEVFTGIASGVSTSELWSYTVGGSGVQITSGSPSLNALPISVVNGVAELPVLWLFGTISSSTDFDFGIKAVLR